VVAGASQNANPDSTAVTGTLSIGSDGKWTYNLYNSDADAQGLTAGQQVFETFTVKVTDEHGASDTQTVKIKVTGTNDAPVAGEDHANAVTEVGTLADHNVVAGDPTATGSLLANSSDVDNASSALTIKDVSFDGAAETDGSIEGKYGTLTWDAATGGYTYTLDNNRAVTQALNEGNLKQEVFTYTAKDPGGLTDTATLTIDVNGANDDPIAKNDIFGLVPDGWTFEAANGHIYKFVSSYENLSWDTANALASTTLGVPAYLATITS
jgi:VCBS repeat-containing protein